MKKEKKNIKSKVKKAIIICGIIIFLLLLIIFIIPKNNEQKEPEQVENVTQEDKEETITNYVRNKGEKERMQIYLAEYIRLIEQKKYNLAYEKIYPQFKQNYFPTIDFYKEYVESNYSELMMIEYDDIQRQGKYYILSVIITNLGEIETEKVQKFIIYENGLNDYYISFQAE